MVETEEGAIHVDDPKHPEYRSYGDEDAVDEEEYHAPILAPDEVEKDSNAYLQRPAIHPHSERRGSNYDSEDGSSRPTSRPLSLHNNNSQPEIRHTPLEDVEEYEPLFSEETKEKQPVEVADENNHHNHFPSKDTWEDAPNSVHYTATVSTPDLPETQHHRIRSSGHRADRPITPAHAFAQHQEALAEREAKRRSGGDFLPLSEEKPIWSSNHAHLKAQKPASGPRFPSRDVWEDVPESQLYEAIVSSPEEEKKMPEFPVRPAKKSSEPSDRPPIPTRPKPRQTSGDDTKVKPPVSDKPKPRILDRPAKSSSGDSKEKPPVPSRPAGNKIAALQAGFMSDLNQRLKIGPPVHKKEESPDREAPDEKEKMPLSDARKGRARGPQRRAPAKSPALPAEAAKPSAPVLSFSIPQPSWSIDPEEGKISVDGEEEPSEQSPVKAEPTESEEPQKPAESESKPKPEPAKVDGPDEPNDGEKVDGPEAPVEISEETEAAEEPKTEEKTLAANMAGERVLEVTVEKTDGGDRVEPVDIADEVKP